MSGQVTPLGVSLLTVTATVARSPSNTRVVDISWLTE